jgi:hypothetical protein
MPTWEFHLPWDRTDLVEELVQAADSVAVKWRYAPVTLRGSLVIAASPTNTQEAAFEKALADAGPELADRVVKRTP